MADITKQYTVGNADGTPVEPGAEFLVLRLDGAGQDNERWAAQTYALFSDDKTRTEVAGKLTDIRQQTKQRGFTIARKVDYGKESL
jgi:hypothetical protein